ncbi:MAG TPA: hypothetical protein DEQ09_07600 [Bacteroidales bacterium]|nr:hypothetical protein [Bacteroidales bacterium]
MVSQISKENIELYINKLVGVHTMHNLSVQDDPEKGIGAAWTWVKKEMEKSIPVSGGRLLVEYVDYTVGGEEHGLFGAAHMADMASREKWNIVAILNNDMIGNSGSSGTLLNDNMRVRVFSEGIPAY